MANAPPDDPAPAPDSASAPAAPSETAPAPDVGATEEGAEENALAKEDAVVNAELSDAHFTHMAESGRTQLHDDQFTNMAETEVQTDAETRASQSEPGEGDAASEAVTALNQQITDAIAAIEAALRSDTTMGLQMASDMAATQAAALAMFNAVQAQQRDSMLANAVMARTLSRLTVLSRPVAAANPAAPPSQEKPNV